MDGQVRIGRWCDSYQPGKRVRHSNDQERCGFRFSALSSTAKITGQTTVPLDIVLVLDVSGSMDDPMGRADSTKRIDALKDAVNSFIDGSAKVNDQRADVNKQNRIAVVKFAGNKTSKVGNDRYRQSLYSYNYTQVVSGYKAYTSGNKSEGETTVNALTPAGCTAATSTAYSP